MGPLSARLLMQRGRPKSDRLGKIRSLDLSGLKLLSEHLDPKLLSRLTQLQELDLSNNQLETLPANLGLSHLRILRCANNQLGDVTALCQFPQLEELSLEGNPFLTVSDNLKISFLLPKLRKVNGKDASSTSSQVENLNRELTSRVTAHWEKFKAAVSPEEEAEKAQADFVKSAVRDIRYGPESLSEFTQWRVQMISEELVASGGPQVHEADVPERPPKAAAAQKPRARPVAKKRPDDVSLNLSPNKRVCTSSLAPVEGGPPGSDGGQEFFSVAWTALTVVTQAGHKKRWSVLAAAGLRGLVRLLHVRAGFCCGVIRAHKKAIATLCFSPTHETHLFTASYDKRIILWDLGVPNHDYDFQASQLLTLDTTSIPLRLCPVASCPDAYLLAGCEGGCCCWDVRLDQPPRRSLGTRRSPVPPAPVPVRPQLPAEAEGRCRGCAQHTSASGSGSRGAAGQLPLPPRRPCEVEFVFSEDSEAAARRVDGLAFVNEDVVASKGNGLGTICLWSWSQTWGARGKRPTLAVVVLARLQWSPTQLAYFSLSTCPGEGIVLCGDEEGNVWVYDVRHLLMQEAPLPAAPQAPTQILKWPQPWALGQMVTKTMVNTVVANPTFTYLTALTDSNIVAIWKRQ
ncbi:leucine-rich repeat and WD repeat-containing protein 1 isoform X7 [Mirounga angustirostris]|uniref:leucine-rich repeat and WD repeat-containing protein 1 isoform X7 n=1 Tax=Mirounga angustirostris TaxID=9716 RepID=UPI00313E710B